MPWMPCSQIRTTLIKAMEGERTSSGKVSDYREAAELAESFFCTPEWEAKHVDKTINHVVIFATDASDMIERPTVEPSYSTAWSARRSHLPSWPFGRVWWRRGLAATGATRACVRVLVMA